MSRVASNQRLQPPHSAVTPLAEASVAPAGGRLNGGVRHPGARTVRLLFVGFAISACLACSTSGSEEAIPSRFGKVECGLALEGSFVGGASGVVLNCRFKGRVLRHLPSGRTVPARLARFVPTDSARLDRVRTVALDRRGRFSELYNLEFDAHYYCVGGKVVTRSSVETLNITVEAEGCRSAVVPVSYPSRAAEVVLECSQ